MELFVFAMIAVLVPACVYLDFVVIADDIRENSVTELLQEGLLLLCTVFCMVRAVRIPEIRGAMVLASGFFAAMFVRELDFLFDDLLWHGAWAALVAPLLALCFFLAWRYRATVLPPLARFSTRRPYLYFLLGIVLLLVFSRIFGSGGLLWKHVLGDQYVSRVKAIVQEGLELYGYLLIALGMVSSRRSDWEPPREAG